MSEIDRLLENVAKIVAYVAELEAENNCLKEENQMIVNE